MRVAARGFTLIEVLVTVVILAVLATVLVISVGAGDEEQWLRREAERLEGRIQYACERAELGGREVGMHLRDRGYAFSTALGEQWRFLDSDPALKATELRAGLSLVAGEEALLSSFAEKPQFLCLASGEATPMQIELVAGPRATRWRVDVAFDGRTQLQRRAPDDRDWRTLERAR